MTAKIILYIILILASLHLIRDVLQDLGGNNIITNSFSKLNAPSNIYSYVIEVVLIVLTLSALIKGDLRMVGYASFIFLSSMVAWGIYYFRW